MYLAKDRPDLFTVKELSGSMAKPTLTALQRVRELVGYVYLHQKTVFFWMYPLVGKDVGDLAYLVVKMNCMP